MNYPAPVVYRPMTHPHFALGAVQSELRLGPEWEAKTRRVQTQYTRTLGALGAEQGDLFTVDWEAVKALGGVSYASALLSIAQGAAIGMPQSTTDTAINVVLVRNKAPNMFRSMFGLFPLSITAFLAERTKMVRDAPKDWQWYSETEKAWGIKREMLQANKPAHEISKAELEQLAKIAGWSDKERMDAIRGDNVYKLRQPTPWGTYAAYAGGAFLLWWLLRRAG